jgi:2-dehydropantoate 2-reductase
MKIAIVGCGAVGSYYGGLLARAGQEVHFLLRTDFEVVRRNGVQIRSPKGDFNVRPKCAKESHQIGQSDLVIVAIKTTANERFRELLPPLVGPQTTILTLQNGLGNEESLAELFPTEQIMGGLCFVCLNRIAPGVVVHMDHGMVVLGEYQGWPEPRTHDIASAFRNAGIACKVSLNLAQAHWEKLVWNIPFNGLGVASAVGYEAVVGGETGTSKIELQSCLTTDKLLDNGKWEALVRELMLEVISAANALGFRLETSLAEKQIERTRTMGAYKASTLVDFERGQNLELESLFLEPLRRAKEAGVKVTTLERLCKILGGLQEDNKIKNG